MQKEEKEKGESYIWKEVKENNKEKNHSESSSESKNPIGKEVPSFA